MSKMVDIDVDTGMPLAPETDGEGKVRRYQIPACRCGCRVGVCFRRGPHWGIYCKACGRWAMWMPHAQKAILDSVADAGKNSTPQFAFRRPI